MLKKLLYDKKTYIFLYIFLLVATVFYVKSVFKDVKIDINSKPTEKKGTEVKPVSINLIVEGASKLSYKLRLNNTDSVLDILNNVRSTQGLSYEKTEYISGTEITTVQGISKNLANSWTLWKKNKDSVVTRIIDLNNQHLEDETTYLLIYRSITISQPPEF